MLHALVHAADIQDRDGGVLVMATLFGLYPFLLKLYADGGYQGPAFRRAVKRVMATVNVEIIKRSDRREASSSCPDAGWWSVPSPGSAGVAGWRRTGNVSTEAGAPAPCSPPFASCSEGSEEK